MISQRQRENRTAERQPVQSPRTTRRCLRWLSLPRLHRRQPPHPSLQTWMFRAVQHPAGAEPALEENSTGTACSPALKFSVNYLFHKSPVHTSHFWIASFPLRSQTISLWYNRLYFYINVSSCHEIYCLAGPIRLRRSSTVLWASQPSELHRLSEQLVPTCHSAKREFFMGWVRWIFRPFGGQDDAASLRTSASKVSGLPGAVVQGFSQDPAVSGAPLFLSVSYLSPPRLGIIPGVLPVSPSPLSLFLYTHTCTHTLICPSSWQDHPSHSNL